MRDDVGFVCDLIVEHNLVMLESKRYTIIAYHCEYFRLCTELRTSQTESNTLFGSCNFEYESSATKLVDIKFLLGHVTADSHVMH